MNDELTDKVLKFHKMLQNIIPAINASDYACIWKQSYNTNSTTFQDVTRENNPALYRCTECDNYSIDSDCINYVSNALILMKSNKLIDTIKWRLK